MSNIRQRTIDQDNAFTLSYLYENYDANMKELSMLNLGRLYLAWNEDGGGGCKEALDFHQNRLSHTCEWIEIYEREW